MTERRCIGCWNIKNKDDLIKITADYKTSKPVVQPNSLTFGRSVYLCYNKSCIEKAFQKNKLGKHLKVAIPQELKGQLLDELRNS
ncbi:YlxR family protein [bacterium]|nr:YlxR family protein [bacterium]